MRISFNNYKYNNITFSSRKDVMEKSDEFTDTIIKEARHKNLNRHNVEEIIHSYVPDVKLRLRKAQMKI